MSRKIYSFCKNKQFDNPAKNACRNSFWKVLTTISSLFLLVIFAQQTPANDSSKASESNDKIKIVSISAKLADNRPATALCIVFQQEIFCYYSDNNGKIKRDDDKRFNRSFLDFKPGTLSTWVKNKQLVEKFGGIEKTIEDSLSKTKTLLPTAETILQKIKEEDAPRVIAISKSVGKLEKTYEDFDDYIHENFLTEISNSPDQSKADTPQSTPSLDPPTDNKTSNTSPPQTAQTEQTDYKIYFYSLYILLAVVIVLLVLTVFISGKKKETQKITDIKETVPFVWPEPRVSAGVGRYETKLPFEVAARAACSVFGAVSAIDA
ncbi:MAG: hypothetical protein JNN15_18100, partial [Blastocatellia bacterium]|nr:hypothetical protein [Blastocatellia bacterium]